MAEGKRRVAVLGGGAGGLAAAWELTATPALREQVEVTVHQLGWRLGGKGASGRDGERPARIHEHGLHIWFGWYQQSFDLMKRCYEELPAGAREPFASWREAFSPFDTFVLMEQWRDRWHGRPYPMPQRPGEPWAPRPAIYELGGDALARALRAVLEDVAGWLARLGREHEDVIAALLPAGGLEDQPSLLAREIGIEQRPNEPWQAQVPGALDRVFTPLVEGQGEPDPEQAAQRFVALADDVRADLLLGAERAEAGSGVEGLGGWVGDRLRHAAFVARMLDFVRTVVHGLVVERVFRGERDFTGLDDVELRAWLDRHGLLGDWRRIPFLRGGYDLTFAYPFADRSEPDLAAGVGLRDLMAILADYRGGFMWKMNGGMGDVVFAPLYRVLRERGVKFAFFHWVEDVEPAGDRIGRIRLTRQAEPRDAGAGYAPLVPVGAACCWPDAPRFEQLADGERLRGGPSLEKDRGPLATEVVLEHGEDFHDVVLALPAGAHAEACAKLRTDRAFDAMVAVAEDGGTVATRALQLWIAKAPEVLCPPERGSVSAAFDGEFDTISDMSHVLPYEHWPPEHRPLYLAYLCSVFDHRTAKAGDAGDRIGADPFVRRVLRRAWPNFDPETDLFAQPSTPDVRPLQHQYMRENATPQELYVLSRAGTIGKRLGEGWAAWHNLVVAGDWTRTGIDAGCVEAAVVSGRRAGRALLRRAGLDPAPSPFDPPPR